MNLPVNTAGSIEPHARITLRTGHDTRPVRLEIEATGAGIGLTHLGLNSKTSRFYVIQRLLKTRSIHPSTVHHLKALGQSDANVWCLKRSVALRIFWKSAAFLCMNASGLCMAQYCPMVHSRASGGAMFKAETLCLPWACISACRRLAPDAGWDAMACGPLKKSERMHVRLCHFFRNLLRVISPNIPFRDHPESRSDRHAVLKGQPGDNGFESQPIH
ncbi:hypothetical protein ACI2S3_15865 [Ralstonia nicotianae]|uniref:Transposase n=3 Tax=Ralstonia TaxID=48736 RepID=A0ABX7ZYV4_9RALS|nr:MULTISPECIES: hypothetical protein [Ralstonia]ANH35999.1 hypothetical protein A3768_5209 [Ralstonia solanacearum]AXW16915.1 hypothetical protein CJO84_20305 [Ralstonia solanacearum]AXW40937.1 hypothetical protein CJO89_22395 [Ralstonia solanacearum]AXW59833.1 hypothetical protein CJO93_21275 [Ralstonia solanacearum]AXW73731.1 hypothetical protein CJO96_21705 [Ralstonia solanacearum]